ncbi:MAG: hypothetical protein K8F56_16315 [Rhodocyclaceae bacterium]|nr:hypothetical protein [Rhodocyclaceae bacterium]
MKRIPMLCFALLALLLLGAPLAAAADTGPPGATSALDSSPLEYSDSILETLAFEAATDPALLTCQRSVESFRESVTENIEPYCELSRSAERAVFATLRGLRPPPRAVRC